MAGTMTKAGLGGSILALVASFSCCVLPMSLMLAGLGGNWLAVFSPLAAISPYIAGISVVILLAAWFVAIRRKASRRSFALLAAASVLSAAAWLVLLNDAGLTRFFLGLMD